MNAQTIQHFIQASSIGIEGRKALAGKLEAANGDPAKLDEIMREAKSLDRAAGGKGYGHKRQENFETR